MTSQRTDAAGGDPEGYPEIEPGALALPEQPEVVDVRIAYEDPVLDDMVLVWVIVPDETPESQLIWPAVEPIEEKIRGFFRDRGMDLFPMVRFRRQSELDDETGE